MLVDSSRLLLECGIHFNKILHVLIFLCHIFRFLVHKFLPWIESTFWVIDFCFVKLSTNCFILDPISPKFKYMFLEGFSKIRSMYRFYKQTVWFENRPEQKNRLVLHSTLFYEVLLEHRKRSSYQCSCLLYQEFRVTLPGRSIASIKAKFKIFTSMIFVGYLQWWRHHVYQEVKVCNHSFPLGEIIHILD